MTTADPYRDERYHYYTNKMPSRAVAKIKVLEE